MGFRSGGTHSPFAENFDQFSTGTEGMGTGLADAVVRGRLAVGGVESFEGSVSLGGGDYVALAGGTTDSVGA